MRTNFAMLRTYFKEKPSLEDYVAAHNVTNPIQIEYLEKQYRRFMVSKNFWGSSL